MAMLILMLPAASQRGFNGNGAPVVFAAQEVTFEGVVADLRNSSAKRRLRAVQMLRGAAYFESAGPLAAAILDGRDEIQFEAIAAELNIFHADKVASRRRVGFVVEARRRIEAFEMFTAGPAAVGPERVPLDVPLALAAAFSDDNPRVAAEAYYAYGVLAGEVSARDRATLAARTAPLLAAGVGSGNPILRAAAIRVAGRVFAWQRGAPPADEGLGDAVISALNDREPAIRQMAMWALGSMRYGRAVQGLTELFQHYEKGPMAEAALDGLARIGHPASLPQFVAQLSGDNRPLRLIAIEGLARVGEAARAESVQSTVRDESDDRMRLAGHFANIMLANGPLDAVVDALARPRLREQALSYLLAAAPGRVAALMPALQHADRGVRLDVIEVLGLAGDRDAVAALAPLADGKDPATARAVARALARLPPSGSA